VVKPMLEGTLPSESLAYPIAKPSSNMLHSINRTGRYPLGIPPSGESMAAYFFVPYSCPRVSCHRHPG
jgi:hypothetical protein